MSDYEDEPDNESISNSDDEVDKHYGICPIMGPSSDDEVDDDYGICPITGAPISECIEFNGTYFDKEPMVQYLRSECAIETVDFNGVTGYAQDFYSGEIVIILF